MMRALAGERLLAAWEAGTLLPDLRRPLVLLHHAGDPDAARGGETAELARLSALPVAARDLALLRLRELMFGPALGVFSGCPACGERLEFTLEVAELAARLEAAASAGPAEWDEAGRRYQLRPVTTDDLLVTLGVPDPAEAADRLLARCLRCPDDPPGGQSPVVPASAVKRFEELHADTEIRCAVDCPACGARHLHDLDIARFLWREVAAAASRLLSDVHLLATAYGWREQDILALSARRRAAYLELAGP
jgi:hypothetical protein